MSPPLSSVLIFFALLLATGLASAGEPPPLRLMQGKSVMAPQTREKPDGPPIGITGEPYRNGNLTGVIVRSDSRKRELWYLNEKNERLKAYFRPDFDVILKVNDNQVASSTDILRNTNESWIKLRIKDLKTNITRNYWVNLEPRSR